VKKLITVLSFIVLSGAFSLNAASISYQFTIDTTTLSGQADNLDFQFNPGDISSPSVSLDISGFLLNGGSFNANDIVLTGDASGTLAGDVTLDNNSGYSDAFQPVELGTSVTFLATFSGAGVDDPASPGSAFGFSIYDNAGTTPLLTTSLDGTIAGIELDADGIALFTNPATAGGTSDATIAAIPEPATGFGAALGLGLLGLVAIRARRRSV
jgi:hypothetical protein